ncbi:unnamed protein product [Camellia sinensis]
MLEETNYTRLCSSKKILTVNGLFPGPTLYVYKGDRLIVNIQNQGAYNVTIHWHGVKQQRNPWSDGPEYITQCLIKPGANFSYEIIFSTEEGTLWWHAHSDWSRATVHGPIIVYPANGTTYPYSMPSEEFPIVLASWFKGDVMELIQYALESGGEPNQSDAFTINGQPGDLYNCSKPGTFKIMADYGKTYLLRIINAIMNEEMFFKVAEHNLAVVGMDVDVPQTVDTKLYITLSVNTLPCVNSSCDGPNGDRLAASLNNMSFVTPEVDVLQAYYSQLKGFYTTDFSSQPPYFFNFTADDVSDDYLTPKNATKVKVLEKSSMHLHGYNLVDPPEVNTVGVPTNGWAAFRFRADNPGV